MKDSGIEWLGEIPEDWVLTKNRYYLEHKPKKFNESDNTSVLSLTTKGVKIKENLAFGKSAESYIGHQLVHKGDIVFCPRDLDGTDGISDVSQFDGCISNLYIVDRTKKDLFNHFLNYYWYGLKYSVNYFKNFSHGMRFSFNRSQFDEIPLLLPSIEEQRKIVDYLDDKTEKIDSLIENIKKKIELLEEQRSALINQVVTKGLDPNVEMKDSGIDWIGEIPKHWELQKPKYRIEPVKREIDETDEVVTCFRNGEVTLRKNRRTQGFTESIQEHGYQQIRVGDLVVHEMDAFEGAIGISDSKGKSTPVYTVIEPNDNNNLRYLMFLLRWAFYTIFKPVYNRKLHFFKKTSLKLGANIL